MVVKGRRQFLRMGAAAMAGGALALQTRRAVASPLGLPLGLQLYSVRELLKTDFAGTLKNVAAIGYQEVEAAGFYGHTPQQVNAAVQGAGLRLVSSHSSAGDLRTGLDATIEFAKAVGVQYVICSFPGFRDPAQQHQAFAKQVQAFTMDDYRWNADRFNEWGLKVKAAGMQFGYHNHTMEFGQQNGVVPFDFLIEHTDPTLVTFEMDCGWVVVGGANPVDYLRRYPTRISMLHIKDFKPTTKPATVADPPPAAELGRGTQNFRPVFEAAKRAGHVKHYFIEQEEFNLPPLESLRIDADYVRALNV